ncbi:SDR family oxidoreductase [Lacibacter sp.]|uniref:SDR family oxidoreductase n=1 Tax=Lacibacter sp. TaxID=1915409 RepID=UPI002B4B58C3|nr:SDR family oxidoreductase [Lacibacter sp.]HLP39384.1 SDR family oxidoreductase [Lacibacter sp.]
MNILLTGANGYIGQRLIQLLLQEDHIIYCCVRNKERFDAEYRHPKIRIIEIDFLNPGAVQLPVELDVAFYLIHSLTSAAGTFEVEEQTCAENFNRLIKQTNTQQIIYLGGIVNAEHLSQHLSSRLHVESILRATNIPLTILRAGIIVGSGSASFEIIRDLTEKLPVMITPQWLNTKCQPIAVRNVLQYLMGVMLKTSTYNQDFDIGGREVLSYKQMILQFAEVRGLKRYIYTLPVMTPRISSYWLYFLTSTSYPLAVNLVNSMKIDVICRPNNLEKELHIKPFTYKEAVALAFEKIEQNMVVSSWKDAFSSSKTSLQLMQYMRVPEFGCYRDVKQREIKPEQVDAILRKIWSIGGETGWYYGNHLWLLRGFLDKLFGGVGLRRGRTNTNKIEAGDALDFWRVLVADKTQKRLLLYAEMKLPGEAWLEFRIMKLKNKLQLRQVATFRPKGIWGRLYWYSVVPFHYFIFNGMINQIVKEDHQKV